MEIQAAGLHAAIAQDPHCEQLLTVLAQGRLPGARLHTC